MTINLLKKAFLSDITVTDISRSFTHNMAAKTSWHRYGTQLRHCHPMYTDIQLVTSLFCVDETFSR